MALIPFAQDLESEPYNIKTMFRYWQCWQNLRYGFGESFSDVIKLFSSRNQLMFEVNDAGMIWVPPRCPLLATPTTPQSKHVPHLSQH